MTSEKFMFLKTIFCLFLLCRTLFYGCSDCVYTHGHWVNNRSLFPSQDVPEALATWQAYITVQQGLTVIMSGDQEPQCRQCGDGE